MATLVERTSRYTVPVALPAGRRDAATTCDALIDAVAGMPSQLRKTLMGLVGPGCARLGAGSGRRVSTLQTGASNPKVRSCARRS
jgi:hypothetical protein